MTRKHKIVFLKGLQQGKMSLTELKEFVHPNEDRLFICDENGSCTFISDGIEITLTAEQLREKYPDLIEC